MGFDFESKLAATAGQQQQNAGAGDAGAGQQQQQTDPAANSQQQNLPGNQPQTDAGQQQNSQQQANNQQSQSDAGANQQQQQNFDVNGFLDRMSEGLIKDEGTLKSVLPQLKEYPELKKQLEEMQKQVESAPKFYDDEVRLYNELKAAGATKEQLRNFQKINDVGNLADISDIEARVARMVIIDGVKESVAKLKVEREFKINDENVDATDRELLDDDLRVAAKKDREELAKYKAEVSSTGKPTPEELQLKQAAAETEHNARLEPYLNDFVSALPHMGSIPVREAKDGQDGLSFDLPISDEARAEIKGYMQGYFLDGLTPITRENTIAAAQYAKAEYYRTHESEIFKAYTDFLIPKLTEEITARFERQTGIKMPNDNPAAGTQNASAKEMAQFAQGVARRRLPA